MGIEQRCGNCFFADHYLPGDEYKPSDGGKFKVTKEFYQRRCVVRVGRFLRRLTRQTPFERVVLVEDDNSCPTGRFIER